MRKSGRQNIFIRRKLNEANANNKPTKAVIYRKKMQISEIWYFFLPIVICHYPQNTCWLCYIWCLQLHCGKKESPHTFSLFGGPWLVVGYSIWQGKKHSHTGAFQLGNACNHPAGAQGCKTFSFSWHSLGLTACKRNTECTTGAQFAVTRWWIDNWQQPQANPCICFPPLTPQRLNLVTMINRGLWSPMQTCVWGKCAALGNENSSLTHTHSANLS